MFYDTDAVAQGSSIRDSMKHFSPKAIQPEWQPSPESKLQEFEYHFIIESKLV
jgi:hypothetical protein